MTRRRTRSLTWLFTALVIALVACKRAPTEVPEPSPTATVEPPPSDGPEGAALADARTFLDLYALTAAETILTRILRDNPKSALAHAYLARAAYRRGQRTNGTCAPEAAAAAEREIAQAAALEPGLADVALVRGYLQFYAGNFGRAKALGAQAAERATPNAQRAALLLAQVAVRAHDFDEAERQATAVVLRVSEGFLLDRAYDVLAEVYEAQHDERKRRTLQQVLARHPGHDGRGRPR
jgi:predicted Zn-dependent protease